MRQTSGHRGHESQAMLEENPITRSVAVCLKSHVRKYYATEWLTSITYYSVLTLNLLDVD